MAGTVVAEWILLGAGLVGFLVPGYWFTSAGVMGKELKSVFASLRWTRWTFPLLELLLAFGFPILAGELGARLEPKPLLSQQAGLPLLFGGAFAAGFALLHGLFAILTGVYPVFVYRKGYRYHRTDDSTRIGVAQAAAGFVTALMILLVRMGLL